MPAAAALGRTPTATSATATILRGMATATLATIRRRTPATTLPAATATATAMVVITTAVMVVIAAAAAAHDHHARAAAVIGRRRIGGGVIAAAAIAGAVAPAAVIAAAGIAGAAIDAAGETKSEEAEKGRCKNLFHDFDMVQPHHGGNRAELPQTPGRKIWILPAGLAVAQGCAIRREYAATGCLQHRLRGGGVPFHGTAQARVEIRSTFGQA